MSVLARSPALSRTATSTFPAPSGGASLVLTLTSRNRTILILGSSRLAASRAFLALDADANVLISAPGGPSQACDEIKHRLEQGQIGWLDFDQCERVQSVEAWTAALEQLGTDLSLVCLTDTVLDASGSSPSLTSDTHTKSSRRRSLASIQALRSACIALRLPLNVADHPSLSDFSFPSMHRFPLDPSTPKSPMSSLQIAISTSGKGCRLATRLKREVVARLPRGVGRAVDNVGRLRDRARLGGFNSSPKTIPVKFDGGHGEDDLPSSPHVPLNSPVPQLHARPSASASTSGATTPSTSASAASAASSLFSFENEEETKRRMRWVAQVSEYWPIEYLANMKDSEFEAVLGRYASKGIVDEGFSELVDATMPLESQQTTSSNSEAQHTASPSTNGAAGSSAQASTRE
jgi:uroporphyrin-III C-methyltransferase